MQASPELPKGMEFLAGGGEATRLILARDWSNHPLGEPRGWPAELKAALSLVLNSPESMILSWGQEELSFFFNETYFPLLGPRLEWAMGAPFAQVWADGWEQAKPIIDEAFNGQSRRFTDLPWKLDTDRGLSDTWWTFSYSRVLDEAGEIAGLFIFTNETTGRVLADKALMESQEQLSALNETLEQQVEQRTAERDRMWNISPDLMVILSPEGVYLSVNPAWTNILGFEDADLIGRHAFDLVHPDDLDKTGEALATARTGPLSSFENRIRHQDGSYRWVQWVAAMGPTEIFAIGRHISDAKEAQARLQATAEQLQQAQKMDAIGQLTGGVAHDFNNLLTIIRGSVELLRRPNITPEKRERYVDAIGETADRAAKLTGQLLAFARRQALTPKLIDVGDTIEGIIDMIRTLVGSHIAIDFERIVSPCLAEVDRTQLETAIVNLAVNARDALDGDGRINIRVGTASGIPKLRGHEAVTGDYVSVSIHDDGAGITADDLPRIFEPFFTTKGIGKGTGLGLSQVIGFAKQSGGDVSVTSSPDQGTDFTLYLPQIIDGNVEKETDRGNTTDTDGGGVCVLLVEDNVEVGAFAAEALAELGYSSIHAPNAVEALKLIDANPDRFHIVFSDVVMPGMNGVELATVLRERYPSLSVVLASGYSHVLADNGQHGFELLQKPYSVEQLSAILKKAAAR